jgi:uncharacterized protein (TIGR01777 family)
MRVAVTGASGFAGGALVAELRGEGSAVLTVGRKAGSDIRWKPEQGQLDPTALAGLDAVVHLAGAPVGERWTSERKRAIRDSRVMGTRLVAQTLASLAPDRRPGVLVCASAVGFYGSRGDEWLDESSAPGTDFLASVAREWEAAADPARAALIRVVHLRTGLILSPRGGALHRMLPAFRLGAGARLGTGRQWMSWIALHDWIRVARYALATASLAGPVNAATPTPVTNTEFTTTLGHVLGRPTLASVPAFALRAIFGEMGEATLLASQRVRPACLASAGFAFSHPLLEDALRFEMAG